jgi:hypothetical protein
MILSCCAVDFASAERAFSCVHWLPIGTTRPMRTAHAIHRGSSAIVSSAAGLRVCQRLTLSAQHIRRTQAELVGFSANAPSPRRAHSTRAVQSDSAPRPAPPLDHIESAAWGGGRFCVRIARALRAQPAALPTEPRARRQRARDDRRVSGIAALGVRARRAVARPVGGSRRCACQHCCRSSSGAHARLISCSTNGSPSARATVMRVASSDPKHRVRDAVSRDCHSDLYLHIRSKPLILAYAHGYGQQ